MPLYTLFQPTIRLSNNLSGSSVLISKYEGSFALIRVKSDINIKLIKFPVQGRKMRAKNT